MCHNSSKDNHRSNWETLLKKILSPHHFCVLEDGSVQKTDADDTPSKVSQKRKTVEKFCEPLTNFLNFGFHFLKNVQEYLPCLKNAHHDNEERMSRRV